MNETHITLLQPDSYIYIGWGILLFLSLVAGLTCYFTKRRWLKWTSLLPLCFLWPIFLYGAYVGVHQLEIKHVDLTFKDLPEAFDGYTIVQFSDVHTGTLTGSRQELLKTAIDSINAQKADMVVFTGDLQNKVPSEIEPCRALLSSIEAKDGVYSVLGNHDYTMYDDGDALEQYTNSGLRTSLDEELGWIPLNNARCFIHRDNQRLVIAGMDNDGDGKRFPQNGDLSSALYRVKRQDFVVLLEHDPSAWRRKILPHSHVQLTLSGHTHGGQLSLFGLSPAFLKYKEYSGLYTAGNRCLYVSNGLSGVVPFRVGVPAEITVITLHKK
jgi:predicted MPP superfamily phosphohydrolase